jgi:hypothetical protein
MNVDFDELDGELGTHVDLLAPESIGLEELDLAWAGEDDEEQTLDCDTILLASPKRPANYKSSIDDTASNAFLTGSTTPKFTGALPAPLSRKPSFMGDIGKGKATVGQADPDETAVEASPPRRVSARRSSRTSKPPGGDEEEKQEEVQADQAETQDREQTEEDGDVGNVRRSERKTRSALASPRKSSRRVSTAAAK